MKSQKKLIMIGGLTGGIVGGVTAGLVIGYDWHWATYVCIAVGLGVIIPILLMLAWTRKNLESKTDG